MNSSDIDLRELLKADFGIDFPISGGTGNSLDTAIVIHYEVPNYPVGVERGVLRCLGLGRGIEWKLVEQLLLEHNGRRIDKMTIETKETTPTQIITQTESYYFDITECFGR